MPNQIDIHQRIFSFVVTGLKVPQYLPKTETSRIISNQFLRSLTSTGANDNEADGASSRKDFIHCYTIVRKELKETSYWLKIISESSPNLKIRLTPLIIECEELIKITSSIIKSTIQNNASRKI